jgi:ERCC4-type nuclease
MAKVPADTTSIKIIADSAESRSGVISRLKRMPGYEVEVLNLDSGDYIVGEGCVVERKSARQFYNSILDGRYIAQGKMMAEAFVQVIYIIEGDLNDTPHNFTRESVFYGALYYLSELEGISIIQSSDVEETAALIATMARHSQKGLRFIPPLRLKKPAAVGDDKAKLYIIERLPGIGRKKARDVLAYFGSVQKVFAASREEWLAMPNMGPASLDKILAVIRKNVPSRWISQTQTG